MIKFLKSHPALRTIVFFIIYTPEEKKLMGALSALWMLTCGMDCSTREAAAWAPSVSSSSLRKQALMFLPVSVGVPLMPIDILLRKNLDTCSGQEKLILTRKIFYIYKYC